ncbi:lipid A-modifier LpxR family protein [Lacinutrix sp.]|uniref:lipid A-modifier LpxR family protein n=1 Tax=Lacinutrix sp. TaxID=1937692 RepID=UPI0025C11BEA|nr:lipid A-modifier LpxR family protein [Lacinutrix sp.]
MKKTIFFIAFLIVCFSAFSQNNNEQLELVIENDKLVLVDKYYTSGLFLTYKKDLQNNFIFKKQQDKKLQLNIVLGNQTYTPSNLTSIDTRDFDRPYAGWFFVKTEIGKINKNSALFIGIETGITGEESLSGKLQNWFHETLNIPSATWIQEIEFKFLVNLKARYIISKTIGEHSAFKFVFEPSLGTKDIFIANNLGYTFGRFNTFNQSSRNGFLTEIDTNEFFGFINIGYKYVAHNALIQGSLDYNDALFTTNKEPHIINFKIGSVLKLKRNTFTFVYNYNTKETPISSSHSFGTISFSRDF